MAVYAAAKDLPLLRSSEDLLRPEALDKGRRARDGEYTMRKYEVYKRQVKSKKLACKHRGPAPERVEEAVGPGQKWSSCAD